MVNITKRMHNLMPKLWQVKGGPGAAILPSNSSAPQLTSITLRIPNPTNGYDAGARDFWRSFLPAFRYHNLTIPINVEQKLAATPDFAPTLTLNFEAPSRDILDKQNIKPEHTDADALSKSVEDLQKYRSEMRTAEVSGGRIATFKKDHWVEQLRKKQQDIGIPKDHATSIGAVTTKPQPAADPSTPSTTATPKTIYQRSVTLGLRGRHATDIWKWFQQVTGAQPYELSGEEKAAIEENNQFKEQAEQDRRRVKAGIDAMKREQADLKRAKEAADRMTAE